jgi:16S rRNA (adenine1518-N6/adenine1519-N6)-dimethyltransferase
MLQLDQHFLKDKETIRRAVLALHIDPEDIVLEIGPGKGAITLELAKQSKQVIAIELDRSFEPYLDKMPANVQVKYGNVLEELKYLRFNKIISNLPFSISEPFLKAMLSVNLDLAVLFVSKTFYELFSSESKWNIIARSFFDIVKIMDVSRDCFDPRPKTDSVLVKFKRRTDQLSPIEQLICELMLQSDKKLKNALMYSLSRVTKMTKKQAKTAITALDLPNLLEKNVDALSNEQFLSFYSQLSRMSIV